MKFAQTPIDILDVLHNLRTDKTVIVDGVKVYKSKQQITKGSYFVVLHDYGLGLLTCSLVGNKPGLGCHRWVLAVENARLYDETECISVARTV